jgi:hypothetical protein
VPSLAAAVINHFKMGHRTRGFALVGAWHALVGAWHAQQVSSGSLCCHQQPIWVSYVHTCRRQRQCRVAHAMGCSAGVIAVAAYACVHQPYCREWCYRCRAHVLCGWVAWAALLA